MNRKRWFAAGVCLLIVCLAGAGGKGQAAVAAQDSASLPIRLAALTFDPLYEKPEARLPSAWQISAYPAGVEGYYLVQFKGPIHASERQGLVDLGVELFDYVPDFSFIAAMSPQVARQVALRPEIRWVGIYQPAYRISPSLLDELANQALSSAGGRQDALLLNILVFRNVRLEAVSGQIRQLGGTILEAVDTPWRGKLRVAIRPALVESLPAIYGVQWVEKAPEWQLANEIAQGDGVMDVADVWNTHGFYGTGQIGAISDTQLDTGDASTVVNDFKQCGSSAARFTIVQLGTSTRDTHGHGTHTAGSFLGNGRLAGATCGNYTGFPAGTAPEATGYFQALLNTDGSLGGIPADLNDLFQPAYTFGARLHTNSWASVVMGEYTSESQEADQFSWNHKDFMILFAAGNEGKDIDANGVIDLHSISTPGTAKNVFTVGASENVRPGRGSYTGWDTPVAPIRNDDYADDANGLASFSGRGPTDDGRYKPDIVAPGMWVNSVRSTQASGSGNYVGMGGTSMATPLTAGATLLARQAFLSLETYAPSAAMLKSLMVNGATDIYPGQYGGGLTQEIPTTRPTFQAGWGRVDLEDSLFPTGGRRIAWWDQTSQLQSSLNALSTGETATYSFEVLSDMPLYATLAWTDYPGTPAAQGGLVNDLDLRIVGPGGTTYYPNNARQRLASQVMRYASNRTSFLTPLNGQRFAVRVTPTQYPATLSFARLWFYSNQSTAAGSVNFDVVIYDDDGGPGPSGGTVLCTLAGKRAAWGARIGTVPALIDLSSCGTTLLSGDFYLALEFTSSAPASTGFLMDNTPVLRAWYNIAGTWNQDAGYDYAFDVEAFQAISPATSYDRGVNNLEGIDLLAPVTGVYTLTVSGYNIPQGPQPYALTLSGDYRLLGSETVTRPIDGAGVYKFGNTGVSIQFTSEDIDTVSVSVQRDRFPASGYDSVKRYYEITSSGGTGTFVANLTFSYEQAEFDASGIPLVAEDQLNAYRLVSGSWVQYSPASRDTALNTVTVNGVSAFSRWALGQSEPTAVRLQALEATPRQDVFPWAGAGLAALVLAALAWGLRRRLMA